MPDSLDSYRNTRSPRKRYSYVVNLHRLNMNRRQYAAGCAVVTVVASAGCIDTVRDWIDSIESGEGGRVRNAETETFEIEAEAGELITVDVDIERDGSRQHSGRVAIYDAAGNLLESEEISYTGLSRQSAEATAPEDGTYEIEVSPGSDRDAELRVSVWTD